MYQNNRSRNVKFFRLTVKLSLFCNILGVIAISNAIII